MFFLGCAQVFRVSVSFREPVFCFRVPVDQVRSPDVLSPHYVRHDGLNDNVPVSTELQTKKRHHNFFSLHSSWLQDYVCVVRILEHIICNVMCDVSTHR